MTSTVTSFEPQDNQPAVSLQGHVLTWCVVVLVGGLEGQSAVDI